MIEYFDLLCITIILLKHDQYSYFEHDNHEYWSKTSEWEQAGDLLSRSGGIIENVEDLIYLGSWIDGTERDIKVLKGKAWAALHRLRNIWISKLSEKLKIRLLH